MTNDDSIEAFNKECEELENAATNGPWFVNENMNCVNKDGKLVPFNGRPDAEFYCNARTAEPFWRKLAMKYREALIEARDNIGIPQPGYPAPIGFAYDAIDKALALTKKDLEDLK